VQAHIIAKPTRSDNIAIIHVVGFNNVYIIENTVITKSMLLINWDWINFFSNNNDEINLLLNGFYCAPMECLYVYNIFTNCWQMTWVLLSSMYHTILPVSYFALWAYGVSITKEGCGRSWLRATVCSNQRLYNRFFLLR
jgi:hypothetical protein